MKMSTQNPLSGMQAIQQAPGGIPPALAQYFQQQQELQAQQQQQASPMDQSQLADYIKQLQANGASPDQLQGVVQQIQQNGGQVPQQSDTMQGGSGADTIGGGSGNGSQMSPFSRQLNAVASGQGDVNYDQISGAYPTPRAPIVQDQRQLISNALMANHSMDGSSLGAMIGQATAAANQTQAQQKADYQKQLDARDLGAYQDAIKVAQEGGRTESSRAKTDQMADYRENQLNMAQAKLDEAIKNNASKQDIAQQKADIAQQLADIKALTNKTKPLSADLQKQLTLGLDQFIGVRDAKGNTLDIEKDIDPTQKNNILSASAMYLQQNPNVGVQGALGHVINEKLGGVGNIQDATSPWIGKKTPRMFSADKISGLNATGVPQAAPNVSGAQQTVSNGGDNQISPASLTPMKDGVAAPRSQAEYADLPSGTKFVDPNGKIRTKP